METHRILIAVAADGSFSVGLGRAPRVIVCEASAERVLTWEEAAVGWDATHDTVPHGTQHGTILRFLRDRRAEAVIAGHAGPPMLEQLAKMGIAFFESEGGDPQAAATHVAGILDSQAPSSSVAGS